MLRPYSVRTIDETSCRITLPHYWTDDVREYVLFVPARGGYVRRWNDDGTARQICDKLYDSGATLVFYPAPGSDFARMIRREMRARKRADERGCNA